MVALTMDKEYQQERHVDSLNKPQDAAEGLVGGVKDLGKGIFQVCLSIPYRFHSCCFGFSRNNYSAFFNIGINWNSNPTSERGQTGRNERICKGSRKRTCRCSS